MVGVPLSQSPPPRSRSRELGRQETEAPRILHVISGLRRGGAEMALLRLAASPEMAGFRQAVLGVHAESTMAPVFREHGFPAESIGLARTRDIVLKGPRVLTGFQKLRRCEILNGVMYHGCLLATLGARAFPGRALVWNIRHSLDNWESEKATTRSLIRMLGKVSRSAAAIIYDSKRCQAQHAELGYDTKNAVLIPNGLDPDHYRPCPEQREAWRRTLKIPQDAFLVGHVARLDPIKAHPTAFAAAELIAARDPRARFAFVGVDESAPIARSFLDFSAFPERFIFLGERADVPAIMPAFDLFWLTSVSESHPNVILEAMSSGVPCISTDVGDVREIIADDRWIVAVNDTGALAATVLRYLALSEEERAALGQAVRIAVRERFSLARMSARYAEVYRAVLASH